MILLASVLAISLENVECVSSELGEDDVYKKGIQFLVNTDYKNAFKEFDSIKDNSNDAKYQLAVMLDSGRGDIKKDIKKAIGFYKEVKNSESSFAPYASNSLGVLYENEYGDTEGAREFYQKAAAAGCDIAKKNLARLEEEYPSEQKQEGKITVTKNNSAEEYEAYSGIRQYSIQDLQDEFVNRPAIKLLNLPPQDIETLRGELGIILVNKCITNN